MVLSRERVVRVTSYDLMLPPQQSLPLSAAAASSDDRPSSSSDDSCSASATLDKSSYLPFISFSGVLRIFSSRLGRSTFFSETFGDVFVIFYSSSGFVVLIMAAGLLLLLAIKCSILGQVRRDEEAGSVY